MVGLLLGVAIRRKSGTLWLSLSCSRPSNASRTAAERQSDISALHGSNKLPPIWKGGNQGLHLLSHGRAALVSGTLSDYQLADISLAAFLARRDAPLR